MMYPFRDFIPRYTSTATMLIQGVQKEESPANTVCWMIAGYPLTTVAMPLMLLPSGKLPEILKPTDNNCSWLCNKSVELKNRLFEGNISHHKDYINLGVLINKQQTGILQKILPIEQEVLSRGNTVVDRIRKSKKAERDIEKYYDWVDEYLQEAYSKI